MAAYCVDFQGGVPGWQSDPGSFESHWDFGSLCQRGWVVIQPQEFLDLHTASQSGGTGGTGGTTSPQFTTEEVAALKYMAANPSPFDLSVEDGYLVSGSIVGVWVVAWAFRALYLTLRSDGEPTE